MEENKKPIMFIFSFIVMIVISTAIILIIQKQFIINDAENNNATFFYTDVDGTKVNNSPKINEVKTLEDGLIIQVTSVLEKDGYTTIRGTIVNETTEEKGGYDIQHTLFDKDGNTIITVDGSIPVVEAEKNADFVSSIIGNYVNAYSIETKKRDI